MDRVLSGAAIPGLSGPWSGGNEKVHYVPQKSKTRASQSDGLMSYPEY